MPINLNKNVLKIKDSDTNEWTGLSNLVTQQIDSTLSETSTNPIQNATVTKKLNQLSQEKVDKTGITLGKHTDGLIYVFVDGQPKGNGVELGTIVEGDVVGTVDENNNILLSGDIPDGTYTLKYLNEDGTYTEVGSLVVGEIEPEPDSPTYTNLIPLSIDASGNPFVGNNGEVGYKTGYRISASSGGETITNTVECTGFMPVGYNDTLYFKNITFENDVYSNYALYDSSKTYLAGGNWCKEFGGAARGNAVSAKVSSLNNTQGTITEDVAYIRISAAIIDENSICTVNEQIE